MRLSNETKRDVANETRREDCLENKARKARETSVRRTTVSICVKHDRAKCAHPACVFAGAKWISSRAAEREREYERDIYLPACSARTHKGRGRGKSRPEATVDALLTDYEITQRACDGLLPSALRTVITALVCACSTPPCVRPLCAAFNDR